MSERTFTETEAKRLVELAVEAGYDQENYAQRGVSGDEPPLSSEFEDLVRQMDAELARGEGFQ